MVRTKVLRVSTDDESRDDDAECLSVLQQKRFMRQKMRETGALTHLFLCVTKAVQVTQCQSQIYRHSLFKSCLAFNYFLFQMFLLKLFLHCGIKLTSVTSVSLQFIILLNITEL
jgi:hypothetical protein